MCCLACCLCVLYPVTLQCTTSSPFNLPRLLLSLALRPGLQTHMLVRAANWLWDWVIQYACTLPHTSMMSKGGLVNFQLECSESVSGVDMWASCTGHASATKCTLLPTYVEWVHNVCIRNYHVMCTVLWKPWFDIFCQLMSYQSSLQCTQVWWWLCWEPKPYWMVTGNCYPQTLSKSKTGSHLLLCALHQ